MLQFIVLGQIPGTHTQLDFVMLMNIFGVLLTLWLTRSLLIRTLRRYFDRKFAFIRIDQISL